MDILPIGQQVTKALKFRKPFPEFSVAPSWELVNNEETLIASGTSIISQTVTGGWDVTFTVPTNYLPISDSDELTLELFGTDIKGKIRSVEYIFKLMNAADDYTPVAILAEDNEPIADSLILEFPNIEADDIKVTIQDYRGNLIGKDLAIENLTVKRVANKSDVPDRFSDQEFRGYRYDFEVPAIVFPELTRAAYQFIYRINSTNPKLKTTDVHSVFRLNGRFFDFLSKLRMYLDKARLVEIDPTLQWHNDELCNSLIEGINHINGHPSVYTFWTVEDIPLPMSSYVVMAAAFNALNARYLAEGFNAFEFQGLSTSLNYNERLNAITYKIEEIKTYLDTNLTNAKANAIATFGKGKPDESVTGAVKEARALTRIQPSVVNNVYGYGNRRRYPYY